MLHYCWWNNASSWEEHRTWQSKRGGKQLCHRAFFIMVGYSALPRFCWCRLYPVLWTPWWEKFRSPSRLNVRFTGVGLADRTHSWQMTDVAFASLFPQPTVKPVLFAILWHIDHRDWPVSCCFWPMRYASTIRLVRKEAEVRANTMARVHFIRKWRAPHQAEPAIRKQRTKVILITWLHQITATRPS